ncbi:MAG: hypothetical protein HW408_634 [Actinobacteria bacterium]|nr:hypothetical protein [Actinomycetota bacterium]
MAPTLGWDGSRIGHGFGEKRKKNEFQQNPAKNFKEWFAPASGTPGKGSDRGATERGRDGPRLGGRIHAEYRRQRLPAAPVDGEGLGLLSLLYVTDHEPAVKLLKGENLSEGDELGPIRAREAVLRMSVGDSGNMGCDYLIIGTSSLVGNNSRNPLLKVRNDTFEILSAT